MYLNTIDRGIFQASAASQCTSAAELETAERLGLPGAYLVPLGVDVRPPRSDAKAVIRSRFRCTEDSFVALYLGRIHPKKRLETLVEWALADTRVHLVVAGQGDPSYERTIHDMARVGMDAGRVHFVGHVTGDERSLLLDGSDLFALLSHSENFGVAVAEAMAAGLPALVSPGVALSSVIGGIAPALVIQPGSGELKQLSGLLDDPVHLKDLGERMRIAASSQLSWPSATQRLIELYQKFGDATRFPANVP